MFKKPIIKKCPACGSELSITKLTCKNCKIEITGDFEVNIFDKLDNNEINFVIKFLLNDGNLTKLQSDFNESYNMIKNKLDNIKIKLGLKDKNENLNNIANLKIKDNESKVIKRLKEKMIKCNGKTFMQMLRGNPIEIWISNNGNGIVTASLPNIILKWEIFDAIINKANSLGGIMFKGDSAAQNGAKIGSNELALNCIDSFISLKYYNAKIGDTTLRRSTYFSAILAWAGIVENKRSKGNGGYIIVNNEFK